MDFVGIVGDRGSGKTNFMTALLQDYAEAGIPVIANYKLDFDSLTMSFDDIRKIPELVENCVIGLDELGVGADSYEFFTKNSSKITTLVTQIRKRRTKVLYTVQRFNLIARRLRDQTDGFVMMQDMDKGNYLDDDGKLFSVHRDVCAGLFSATFLNENQEIVNQELFDGKAYWKSYDTSEIIWG